MPALSDDNEVPESYRFNEFEIRLADESLWRTGERVAVNRRTFQVLLYLIERRGEVVTKEEFFEKVWGGSFVEDNNLTVAITSLRKALGDNPKEPTYIENIPRKGYRFIAPVEKVFREAETGAVETGDIRVPAPSGRRFRPVLALGAVLVAALLAIAAVDYRGLFLGEPPPRTQVTLAILPFGGGPGDAEIFTNGLGEDLASKLERVQGLRVIDRNSSLQAVQGGVDPIEAARRLNADKVLTGTVIQTSDEFVIDATLRDISTDSLIWSRQFRRSASEAQKLPTEIAESVAKSLCYTLSEKERARISKRPTENPEAYNLYLKGRYYWNKRTNPDIDRGIEFFKQALDLDPTFALAYVGLADAYTLNTPGTGASRKDRIAMARAFAKKALDIDDTLGDAYASLAINETFEDWNFASAELDYRKAIEMNPGDATAHHWLAELLAMQGRFDESISEYDIALAIDPLSFPIRTDRALSYYYAHDFDRAIELLNSAKDLDPEYVRTNEFLYITYREKRAYSEAIDAYDVLWEKQFQRGIISSGQIPDYRALVKDLRKGLDQGGEKGYWQAFLKNDLGKRFDPYTLAIAYAKLGDNDRAFSLLEQCYSDHSTTLVWIKVAPELDSLRGDPRFSTLVQRVGLN